ncbi:hypothetical protein BOX15_Mlig010210g2 [Macrostomum lignano]|uniref:Uncharacterized protein n=2 Tax=Macrostomum lignano TaxID=282301 RepID=A0A267DWY2_9PLAT|nr:hypothetical protein BOX15_Mlig010210g2 [Macrostomum lignano]
MSDQDLTPEQVEELEEAFSLFDEDGSGDITIKELEHALRAFGFKPSDDELKKMIQEIDKDGNGAVNFDEFKQVMRYRVTDSVLESEVQEAFRLFDLDGDNFINASDLKQAMLNMGERLTDVETEMMLRLADRDGDGRIDLAEFRRVMQDGDKWLKLRAEAVEDILLPGDGEQSDDSDKG